MRVVYPNAEYKVDNDICGYVHRYHEMTGGEVMEITMFQDIFEMIVNNVVDVDFSNKEQVIRVFEGLGYFDSKLVDKFLANLYDHIYKLEEKQARIDIEAFIEENLDRVKWDWLSMNRDLPEEFFERHLDKVVWKMLSRNKGLSEEFFSRHLDKVYWEYLSCNRGLSEEFFSRHIEKVNWTCLSDNSGSSEEF